MAEDGSFDTAAFLERIGLDGQAGRLQNDLESLAAIVAATVTTVPFENFDVALGRGVDLTKTFAKVVTHKRGGYCFENNGMMCSALSALGFRARRALCRVLLGPVPSSFTHMVTIVSIGSEEYHVDVAFGGQQPRRPLPLGSFSQGPTVELSGRGAVQVGEAVLAYPEAYRFVDDGGEHVCRGGLRLQSLQPKQWLQEGKPDLSQPTESTQRCWKDLYVFHPEAPVYDMDVKIGNWSQSSDMPGNFWRTIRLAVLFTAEGKKIMSNGWLIRERRVANGDLKTLFPEAELPLEEQASNEELVLREEVEIPSDNWLETLRAEFGVDLTWDHCTESEKVPVTGIHDFLPTAQSTERLAPGAPGNR